MSMAECKQAVLVEKETAHRDCLTGCYDKMTIQYLVDLCFLKSDVVLGKFYNPQQLGFYSQGQKWMGMG